MIGLTGQKVVAALILGLAALNPAWAAEGGGAMEDLKDLDALKAIVDADFGSPRLLVLLSPT